MNLEKHVYCSALAIVFTICMHFVLKCDLVYKIDDRYKNQYPYFGYTKIKKFFFLGLKERIFKYEIVLNIINWCLTVVNALICIITIILGEKMLVVLQCAYIANGALLFASTTRCFYPRYRC